MGSTTPNLAVYTLRVEREQLDRLSEIAAAEHRTLVQKLRVMIEREIADHACQAYPNGTHQLTIKGRRSR